MRKQAINAGIFQSLAVGMFSLMLASSLTGCERLSRAFGHKTATVSSQPRLTDFGAVESFTLTERDGSAVTLAALQGKIWVVNFIFTRCMGPCPLMSGHMRTLYQHFNDDRIRFVSVSTDPDHDTPAILREYAERFEVNDRRWLFLTGEKAAIVHLARDVMKLSAGDEPDMHSARFVLVDSSGHIRGYYDSQDGGFQDSIKRDIETLRQQIRS